ncbi:recombination mediator RecR [Allisonella histaminiformans]|jgi:recombination protein RecR|uniref:Recombination protein RecR n=1 Tax=Allisonella histaminiformans TaxID=209880 RepID=A0A1G5WES2_9FIRM|nr:recombination mediator RecR [Allisonella histaminiformans]PWL44782.1 MAG: recombination protein RecR [Veillonellaceae bacterium]MCI6002827.1 recombination mediator RecR [Allisonella histaminiformans]MDD6870179.1 recombination mediator RecR [Allisonella histaminiformans]MDY3957256.1 recombination mediator RecR [Allisonella histaminiformans]MDY4539991.1 recombination mediator RecR [Allisonella histaminiformans]
MKDAVEIIAEQFRRLPGIGIKSARRLAYFMLERPQEDVDTFLNTIKEARAHSCYCSICGNLSTSDPCPICSDDSRDQHTLCVVEQPPDVQAMEKSQEYHGLYHVLHGALSPLDGIGPEQLRIKELLHRLESSQVKEVIIATDPDTEGEATAYYLSRLIKPSGIKVTRIARGLPAGGDIGYADSITLAGAVQNRKEI